jgi:predicted acylesterase/phospholipase RssA
LTPRGRAFCALPGGASHASTLAGAALAIDERVDVVGWSGVSAGFLIAALGAFGELPRARPLLDRMLQGNRVLDPNGIDGDLGLCAWEVIPRIVDDVFGADARMGDALTPLVGVVTSADCGGPVYLSKLATPGALLREVARASTALVPLARMVRIPSLGTTMSPDLRLFFDGGFTDNLPDHVFDDEHEPTISVRLGQFPGGIVRVQSGDPIGQAFAVARAVTFAQCRSKSRREVVRVDIDAVGSGLDFDLTPVEIRERIQRGRAGVVASDLAARVRALTP